MFEPLALLQLLAVAAASSAGTFVLLRLGFAKQLSRLRDAHAADTRVLKSQYEIALLRAEREAQSRQSAALLAAERAFEAKMKEQSQPALSVTIHPFVNTNRDRGVFSSETRVEVGYKYQLLSQGLPCFEPHTVIVETTREKEVNDETIELLKNKALELAQLAATAKSGGFPGAAFSIAKAVVQRIK